jgi:hypothetical protein
MKMRTLGWSRRLQALCALTLISGMQTAGASAVATQGCPLFHCSVEATGVVAQSLITSVSTSIANGDLGTLVRQGCSGNGANLTCLYSADKAKGKARGTLKSLNATTLQPNWGSAGAANSYNLDAPTAADGQVPVDFSDGSIAAGDAYYEVRYNSSGRVLGKLALDGVGKNLGMTPISSSYGVVSQSDGFLTLVDLAAWTNVGTLTLLDPLDGSPIILVSASTGASNVVYAIGYDSANNVGALYSITFNSRTKKISVHSSFAFTGSSGACPVVVTTAMSGLPDTLVLLAAPGLSGDPAPQNRLLALTDSSTEGLAVSWALPLTFGITVSPTVDQDSETLFYQDSNGPNVYQVALLTGVPLQTFNLQSLGGFSGTFALNGHLGASQAGSVFTLLLSAEETTALPSSTEYVIAFQPIAAPSAPLWAQQISSNPVTYTAAWNFAPSQQAGTVCPIAITDNGAASSLVRLCDH